MFPVIVLYCSHELVRVRHTPPDHRRRAPRIHRRCTVDRCRNRHGRNCRGLHRSPLHPLDNLHRSLLTRFHTLLPPRPCLILYRFLRAQFAGKRLNSLDQPCALVKHAAGIRQHTVIIHPVTPPDHLDHPAALGYQRNRAPPGRATINVGILQEPVPLAPSELLLTSTPAFCAVEPSGCF